MDPLPGVVFIQGDFREPDPLESLKVILAGREVDLVISDMAPNVSGMAAVDQPRSMYLCELAQDFARESLKTGGDFLIKVFQGAGFDEYLQDLRRSFGRVTVRKPRASRPRSREVYIVARNLKV